MNTKTFFPCGGGQTTDTHSPPNCNSFMEGIMRGIRYHGRHQRDGCIGHPMMPPMDLDHSPLQTLSWTTPPPQNHIYTQYFQQKPSWGCHRGHSPMDLDHPSNPRPYHRPPHPLKSTKTTMGMGGIRHPCDAPWIWTTPYPRPYHRSPIPTP